MKTRQQRLAQERAGHPPSPPQQLADNPRGPRRTRAKKPSGRKEPISSENAKDPETSTKLTPAFDRRQFAHQVGMIPSLPPSRIEPQLQETPRQIAPLIPYAHVEPSSQEPPRPMVTPTPPARAEPPLQETSRPMAPYTTAARVQSPLSETFRPGPMAPHIAPPPPIELPPRQDPHPAQSPYNDQPIHTMSQSVSPAYTMHQAVTPSPRDLVDKQTLEQGMPEQEFGDTIKPKQTELVRDILSPSQSQTANGSARRKRRAFSRKPLLPLPMEHNSHPVPSSPESVSAVGIPAIFRNKSHLPTYTPDGTALYGKLHTTASAPNPHASPESHHMSQQLDEEASVNEDSDTDEVSETGSTTGHLAESSPEEAAQSTQERTPENPRGSRWGLGSLIESARSVTRRFGFSPLTPVSERSELALQTQTARTAPTQTKKKSSLPTSARAKRAKNRRHIDSVAKPARPITTGPNQRDQQSRARKANPASGSTEATATGTEHSPATRRIHRDQEEARKSQGEGSGAAPTIRFPSRSLDRMAIKRKRWGTPDTIPNPKGKSYGLGEAEFYGNFDELENEGGTEQQPGKVRRTSELGDFSSQVAGNPRKARPYTGSMFEKSATEYNGGNVFSEYEAARKAEEAAAKMSNTGRQSLAKTPIPITNSAGTFKVPSPGDSDWSDSESDEDVHTAGLEDVSPTVDKDGELESAKPTLPTAKLPKPQQIVKPKKSYLESLLNPPSSRVADHSLLERPSEGATAESEALRKARDRALQHKPRNPSTLSQSSRTYSSPPVPNEDEMKADKCQSGTGAAAEPSTVSNPGITGHPMFNAYEKWRKTASPAVTAAIGRMEVDPNLAGNAFSAALENPATPNGRPKFNAFEEWSKTASPAVNAAVGKMEVDPNLAGDAFSGALDNFTTSRNGAGQKAAAQSTQAASSDTFGSILPNLRPFTPLTQYGISQRVEDYLKLQWDEEDEHAAITGFHKAFEIFKENESATAAVAVATAGLVA